MALRHESLHATAATYKSANIDAGLIERLLVGDDVREFNICDVSDCQLYGSNNKRKLAYSLAKRVVAAGFVPVVFQSVYWACLVYLPVVPLGTYLVLTQRDELQVESDAELYRGVKVAMDWRQVAHHAAIGLVVLLAVVTAIGWLIARS